MRVRVGQSKPATRAVIFDYVGKNDHFDLKFGRAC